MKDFNKLDFFIQKKRSKLIEKYVPRDSVVLDIGCGYYPQNLLNLASRIQRGLGLDKEIPTKSPSDKIEFLQAFVAKTLPLADGGFDCVLMLAVLEHLSHPAEIIRECYRVLQPGGKLIITIPSNYAKPVLLSLAVLGLISKEEIFGHRHYFSKREIEKMLAQARFKSIVSTHYNLFLNLLCVSEK